MAEFFHLAEMVEMLKFGGNGGIFDFGGNGGNTRIRWNFPYLAEMV